MSSGSFNLSLPPATRLLTLALLGFSGLLLLMRLRPHTLSPGKRASLLEFTTKLSAHTVTRTAEELLGTKDENANFPWLVLVPGKALWYPWTLLTSAFVENGIWGILVSAISLPLSGRYLERIWGQTEFLKFVAVVVVASNIITVVVCLLEGIVLGDYTGFMLDTSYNGLMALQVGFLVAFTQLIPEHQVQLAGLISVRVKSLPMAYVGLSNVACILGYQSPYIIIQFGWLVSWFYLRFVKMNEGGEFRGDRSDTFAFAAWFPPFVQPYVAKASKVVFDTAVRFRLTQPWTDIESGSGVPGGARAEAERRRAMALKALDQRMASKPAAPSSPTTQFKATASAPSDDIPLAPVASAATSAPTSAVDTAAGESKE
ncbi:integral membrane DUF1751 family protein [Pseudohyphozyma bogoriensis]|nr:integral membrane DUF1751 family protein [Pseudohyphozyma bogoriensis]